MATSRENQRRAVAGDIVREIIGYADRGLHGRAVDVALRALGPTDAERDARLAQLEAVAEAAEKVTAMLESDEDLEDGAADGVTVRQVLARDLRVRLAALRQEGGGDG